jgi:hypothetical protein
MNILITPKTGALCYESGTPTVKIDPPVYSTLRAVPFDTRVRAQRVARANLIHGPPLAA